MSPKDHRKWRVTYRTPTGGTFVRLWPSHYGETEEEVRRRLSSRTMLRTVGEGHVFDPHDPRKDTARAESLRIVKVERSSYTG